MLDFRVLFYFCYQVTFETLSHILTYATYACQRDTFYTLVANKQRRADERIAAPLLLRKTPNTSKLKFLAQPFEMKMKTISTSETEESTLERS